MFIQAPEGLDEGKKKPDESGGAGAIENGTYTVPVATLFSRLQDVHANATIRWDAGVSNNGFENHYRDESTYALTWGNQLQSVGDGTVPAYPDVWMRLKREGSFLNTYRSVDGTAWTMMTSRYFPKLAPELYVGMDYMPELGNNGARDGLKHGVLARYRNYSITIGSGGTTGGGGKFTGIKVSGGNVVIDFTGGTGVQSATSVLGPWTDVSGTSPLTVPVSGAPKYYRFKP